MSQGDIICMCCEEVCGLKDNWDCKSCDDGAKWWRSPKTKRCYTHGDVEDRKLKYLDDTAQAIWECLFQRLRGNVLSDEHSEYLIEEITRKVRSECIGATQSYNCSPLL